MGVVSAVLNSAVITLNHISFSMDPQINRLSSFEVCLEIVVDLTVGLQVSELITFVFNEREVGAGRCHPTFIELSSDGSELIQNSNNAGGANLGSGLVVDVDFAEE